MASRRGFEVIQTEMLDDPPAPAAPPSSKPAEDPRVVGAHTLLLLLSVLSQRTVALAGNLLPVLVLAAVGAIALHVIDAPTPLQLGETGIFGVFGLALLWLVRRK